MITKRNRASAPRAGQLAAHHIRPTHQRLMILEYLQAHPVHPTADMIYRDLVRLMPTMSKTTVYNTLKSFVECGIVAPVHITGTETRFECTRAPHHHFFCEHCGRIMDIAIVCPHAVKKSLAGHTVKEQHGYFKGVCAACAKKEDSHAEV